MTGPLQGRRGLGRAAEENRLPARGLPPISLFCPAGAFARAGRAGVQPAGLWPLLRKAGRWTLSRAFGLADPFQCPSGLHSRPPRPGPGMAGRGPGLLAWLSPQAPACSCRASYRPHKAAFPAGPCSSAG